MSSLTSRQLAIKALVLILASCFAVAAFAHPAVIVEPLTENTCLVSLHGEQAIRVAEWGGLSASARADIIAVRLRNFIEFGDYDSIGLDFTGEEPVIKTNLGILATADTASAIAEGVTDKYELAKLWAARISQVLRTVSAATTTPDQVRPYERRETGVTRIEGRVASTGLFAQKFPSVIEGTASWYGPGFHGRRTASGEIFDQHSLSAAHRSLPFGTRLLVTDSHTGNSVIVVVNDRGPFVKGRVLDLSRAAAQKLGIIERGISRVKATILSY